MPSPALPCNTMKIIPSRIEDWRQAPWPLSPPSPKKGETVIAWQTDKANPIPSPRVALRRIEPPTPTPSHPPHPRVRLKIAREMYLHGEGKEIQQGGDRAYSRKGQEGDGGYARKGKEGTRSPTGRRRLMENAIAKGAQACNCKGRISMQLRREHKR